MRRGGGGWVSWGSSDQYAKNYCSLHFNDQAHFPSGTAISQGGGVIGVDKTVTTFTGPLPIGAKYNANTCGGIYSAEGFPGTLPGVVTPPGFITP